jgi:Golgi phosphoprotein 3
MASQGGLTRRRGAGGVTSPTGEEESSSRVNSPAPKPFTDRTPETAYENSENGHRIAYDPRDISESEERSKQPKLTLMEEILLLGLKDKQVSGRGTCIARRNIDVNKSGLPVVLER